MAFLWVIQILVLIGIAILVHEIGHYIVARLFGIDVPQFSIGFGPKIFGYRRAGTEFRMGTIPLGGYVKLSGEEWGEGVKMGPRDLMAKPAGARICVYAAGVIMNVLLAFVLFFSVLLFRGRELHDLPTLLDQPVAGTEAERAGVRKGDNLFAVDGELVENWRDLAVSLEKAGVGNRVKFTVRRGDDLVDLDLKVERDIGLMALVELDTTVRHVEFLSPAWKGGLKKLDRIVAVNGRSVSNWQDLSKLIEESEDESIKLNLDRAGKDVAVTVFPVYREALEKRVIGIAGGPPVKIIPVSALDAAKEGSARIVMASMILGKSVWMIIKGEIAFREALGGPILIAGLGYQRAKEGVWHLLEFAGILNVNLAAINLLPIPALDGGMILFALVEGIRRRHLSMQVYRVANTIGFGFVIGVLVMATYHDILRFFF